MLCPIHCGDCCKTAASVMWFTHDDLEKWIDRPDILKHIRIIEGHVPPATWSKELLEIVPFKCPFQGETNCNLGDLKADKCKAYLCKRAKEELFLNNKEL